MFGCLTAFLAAASCALAQQTVIALWPGVAPGSETWTQKELEYLNPRQEKMVRNVVKPTLTAYLPDRAKASGTAVIVCPGGAYRFLSFQSEGTEVAEWLVARGVAAFVLKYRVAETPAGEDEFRKFFAALIADLRRGGASPSLGPELRSPASDDGRQAVKIVRSRAAEWGIDPARIGMLGFSAGAFLTMDVVTEHDAASRLDFAAPIYGGDLNGHAVPAAAPPLFALAAADDAMGAAASAKLYAGWTAAGRPAELHIYSKGGHGFGMVKRGLPVDRWIERFGDWLGVQGMLKPAGPATGK